MSAYVMFFAQSGTAFSLTVFADRCRRHGDLIGFCVSRFERCTVVHARFEIPHGRTAMNSVLPFDGNALHIGRMRFSVYMTRVEDLYETFPDVPRNREVHMTLCNMRIPFMFRCIAQWIGFPLRCVLSSEDPLDMHEMADDLIERNLHFRIRERVNEDDHRHHYLVEIRTGVLGAVNDFTVHIEEFVEPE